jgi:hypothetical protein
MVAEQLLSGSHSFRVLDVAQLLKHMLALARRRRRWWLYCLWFDTTDSTSDHHRHELHTFSTAVGADAQHFVAMTYGELFDAMGPLITPSDLPYWQYLQRRYGVVGTDESRA